MNFLKRIFRALFPSKEILPYENDRQGGGFSSERPQDIPSSSPANAPESEALEGEVLMQTEGAEKKKKPRTYVNRELSWLKFNDRVLEEAQKESNPLGERLSFASIYQTNLDEFFMVRVGALMEKAISSPQEEDPRSGMTPKEQLGAIIEKIKSVLEERDLLYVKLMKALEKEGFYLVNFHQINDQNVKSMEVFFDREVAPFMEPYIVGRKDPFPFLKNKTLYVVAVLESKTGKERLGIIPCDTGVFPRLVEVEKTGYMLSEELILHFVPKIFKGYEVKAKSLIRVTRSADIDADAHYDEELDYREHMAEIIQKRKRLMPVRLEMSRQLEERIVEVLCDYLQLDREYAFYSREPLDLSFVFTIRDILRQKKELFFTPRVPKYPSDLDQKRSMIEQIKEKDRLLMFPFESITPFLDLLHEAARDEAVTSIQMTLYRVASQSKIIEALIEARENGKEVSVLFELKARFDEENNIAWSRKLESAGCKVVYGVPGFKVHSKLCLITRKEKGLTEYITQVGTGNYNENTARLYTDLSLMTADPAIGLEAATLFSHLFKGKLKVETSLLKAAPQTLKPALLQMIDEEIEKAKRGEKAYIGIKVNSVTDMQLMKALKKASKAGVKVDMVVRGICCLLPKVKGKTDHIRVISIVGRFLEHSRIYIFGSAAQEDIASCKVYISSADFMSRNTEKRFEIAAPIVNEELKTRILRYFKLLFKDTTNARELQSDGSYLPVFEKKKGKKPFTSQEAMLDFSE